MQQNARIISAVFRAVDEINEMLPQTRKLDKSTDTPLVGRSAPLDSLGLVNLIVTTEQNIEDEFGVPIILADEKAISQTNSPFRTIGTLAEYIAALLKENGNA